MKSGGARCKSGKAWDNGWKNGYAMDSGSTNYRAFLVEQAGPLAEGDWLELEGLLRLEDDVLFDWISGRDLPSDPAVLKLMKTLTNAS